MINKQDAEIAWHVQEASIRISLESEGSNQDRNIHSQGGTSQDCQELLRPNSTKTKQLVPPGGQCANYDGGTPGVTLYLIPPHIPRHSSLAPKSIILQA